jgi:fibronectin-binding autotransporter adhesin
VVNVGGEQDVYGSSVNTQIYGSRSSNGVNFAEHVLAGGTAIGTVLSGTINYGLLVDTGGTAIGTLISGGAAAEEGSGLQGGTYISTTLRGDNTGAAFLAMFSSHGLAISTTISSGGEMDLYMTGVTASNTVIYSGGSEFLLDFGGDPGTIDVRATISGGYREIRSFGTAIGATIYAGSQVISSGGTASNTTLSGGTQIVLSGGLADPTTVFVGGLEIVSGGGTDLGAKISGGIELDSGFASGVTVFAGSQVVESGGTASGTTVSNGGTLAVLSGGSANGSIISAAAAASYQGAAPTLPTALAAAGQKTCFPADAPAAR